MILNYSKGYKAYTNRSKCWEQSVATLQTDLDIVMKPKISYTASPFTIHADFFFKHLPIPMFERKSTFAYVVEGDAVELVLDFIIPRCGLKIWTIRRSKIR